MENINDEERKIILEALDVYYFKKFVISKYAKSDKIKTDKLIKKLKEAV
jgi:hypothetical protein